VGKSLPLLIALLLSFASLGGGTQATHAIPPVEDIVRRLIKAHDENRNRLRPYEVLRSYKVFAKEESRNKSEVVAAVEFIPPNVEKFRIHKSEGTGLGEKIVRRILQSENQILANPSDTGSVLSAKTTSMAGRVMSSASIRYARTPIY
jgi:hypothetical protein